jgi:hypothetical protein
VDKGTKVEEQQTAQTELPGKLLAQLEPALNKLPEDQRNAIVGKIAFSGMPNAPIELREFPAQAAALPTGQIYRTTTGEIRVKLAGV